MRLVLTVLQRCKEIVKRGPLNRDEGVAGLLACRSVSATALPARLKDVAVLAGVSVKTVSNVVNDYPYVRPTTRAKVQQAIDALGYRPNMTARNLRSGRSGVIALAVPELNAPYFAELAHHVVRAAMERGWTVLVDETGPDQRPGAAGPGAQRRGRHPRPAHRRRHPEPARPRRGRPRPLRLGPAGPAGRAARLAPRRPRGDRQPGGRRGGHAPPAGHRPPPDRGDRDPAAAVRAQRPAAPAGIPGRPPLRQDPATTATWSCPPSSGGAPTGWPGSAGCWPCRGRRTPCSA